MATIEQLYQQVLGRPADPGGLAYYQNLFGPTIEPEEVNAFLGGAVASGEVPNMAQLQPAAQSFISSLSGPTQTINLPVTQPRVDTTNLFTGGGSQGATVNLPAAPAGFQGATRDQVVDLYRSIGLPNPSDADINWWMNFSRTNPDVLNASNPMTQLTNAFRAASTQGLTPAGLPTTGESRIDPAIAPYLTEALGVARNLFLLGEGPELYPGQMYVSPSAATLDALKAAETLGRSTTATGLGADVLGAYKGGLSTLSNLASPDYMESQAYKDYVSSVTRPVTEAVTEQILPAIASQYSAAGRYGSGAMAGATGMATERGARAVGDITSQIAQRERENQLSALGYMPSFLGGLSGVVSGALAPSGILANVGAQREAIAAQPLQEAIQRFEYGQNLPYNQLSGYLSSIYGSPLGNLAQPQGAQTNRFGQTLGGALIGSQLGGLFGGAGGFTGGQIGTGLGALAGLLF